MITHSNTERRIAHALVKAALDLGYSLSVHDGEDWAIRRSTDAAAIKRELAATDDDRLVAYTQDGARVGFVWLVYGNDEDLLTDHTDNDATNAWVKAAGQSED